MIVNPARRLLDLVAELDGPDAYKLQRLAEEVNVALSSQDRSLDALGSVAEQLRRFAAQPGRLDVNTAAQIEQIAAALDEEAEADWAEIVYLIEQAG